MTRKTNSLDYIRIIAALLVFMLHTSLFSNNITDGAIIPILQNYFFLYTPAWAGVWIFIIISGYLIANGFLVNRYCLNKKGILEFYLSRLIKIGVPTLFFLFLCCVLVYPNFIQNNKGVLVRLLTFTYNGIPGVDGIGAVWYVSTIMQLYLISPLIIYLIEKIRQKIHYNLLIWLLWVSLILIGLVARITMFYFKADWYSSVYTFSLSNIDLFVSGILVNYLPKPQKSVVKSTIVWILFLLLILLNCYIYSRGDSKSIFIYQYLLPSVYAIIVNLLIFYSDNYIKSKKVSLIDRVTLWFSNITFQFYLWHSLILSTIVNSIAVTGTLKTHFKLLGISFILTTIIASFFSKAFNILLKPVHFRQ